MAKKKPAKKKAAKKKAAKKASKKRVPALERAAARVTGLKLAVQAAELVQRSRASLRNAPKGCRDNLRKAQLALQKAIRSCS